MSGKLLPILSSLLLLLAISACGFSVAGTLPLSPTPEKASSMVAPSRDEIIRQLRQVIFDAGYPEGLPDPEVADADDELQRRYKEFEASLIGARVAGWQGEYIAHQPITAPPFTMNGFMVIVWLPEEMADKEKWANLGVYFDEPTSQIERRLASFHEGDLISVSGTIMGISLYSGSITVLAEEITAADDAK